MPSIRHPKKPTQTTMSTDRQAPGSSTRGSSTTGTLTPSSECPPTMGRTSAMPDEQRYTARLRRLRDRVPAPRTSIVFTGANSAKMNARLGRLAPPKGTFIVKPKNTKSPGYYGGDFRKHEKRTKRYLDGNNRTTKKGGAPVFSGSSEATYVTRMMRLEDAY